MRLFDASSSRHKAFLVNAVAVAPLKLESFGKGETKTNDAYLANAFINKAYLLAYFLRNGRADSLSWDSLAQPYFVDSPIQQRVVNIHVDSIFPRSSVITLLSGGHAHLIQAGPANFVRILFCYGGYC